MSARKARSSRATGSAQARAKASSRSSSGARRDRTPFEISILVASLLAIMGVIVALLMSDLRVASGPPDLRVTVGAAGPSRSGGAPYEVRVRNEGGETAENVEIEVTVGTETRTLNLTAVTRSDEESGVVIFPSGTTGSATAEVQSYSEPAR